MDQAHDATLDFSYDDERRARVVERSVRVEVGEIDDARSVAGVDREGCVVRVSVAAADLVALRAGLNTWIRLVDVAERCSAPSERASTASDGDPEA
jgi:KEOPS complex subunit Pcc1